jgi:hypothetical protein
MALTVSWKLGFMRNLAQMIGDGPARDKPESHDASVRNDALS